MSFYKNRITLNSILFIVTVTIASALIAFMIVQLKISSIQEDQAYAQMAIEQQQHAAYIKNFTDGGLKKLTVDQFLALIDATSTTPTDQTTLFRAHSFLTGEAMGVLAKYVYDGNYVQASQDALPELIGKYGWQPAPAASMMTWVILAMKTSILIDPSLINPNCTPQTCPVLTRSQVIQTLEDNKDFHFSLSYIAGMLREMDVADAMGSSTSTPGNDSSTSSYDAYPIGISFNYPSDYVVNIDPADTSQLVILPPGEHDKNTINAIVISAAQNSSHETPLQWLKSRDSGYDISQGYTDTTISGEQAISAAGGTWIIVDSPDGKERISLVLGSPSLQIEFEAVINSLTFDQ